MSPIDFEETLNRLVKDIKNVCEHSLDPKKKVGLIWDLVDRAIIDATWEGDEAQKEWAKDRCPHCGNRKVSPIGLSYVDDQVKWSEDFRECQICGILFNGPIAEKFCGDHPEDFTESPKNDRT